MHAIHTHYLTNVPCTLNFVFTILSGLFLDANYIIVIRVIIIITNENDVHNL